jgi:hypothetical protein
MSSIEALCRSGLVASCSTESSWMSKNQEAGVDFFAGFLGGGVRDGTIVFWTVERVDGWVGV